MNDYRGYREATMKRKAAKKDALFVVSFVTGRLERPRPRRTEAFVTP